MSLRRFFLGLLLAAVLVPCAPDPARAADTGQSIDARARALLNSQGCKGCHRIDDQGGSAGPDLSEVGRRLTPQQLRRKLVAAPPGKEGVYMPSFAHLSPADLDALVDFLSRQR